jgi:ATP-dependent DNA helicase RecG
MTGEPSGLGSEAAPAEIDPPPVEIVAVERPLPLRELDRALAPVRRMVRFATVPGNLATVRYLGRNLAPHLERAARLDLPPELVERLTHLRAQLDGFDEDDAEGRERRLAELFAGLARIDLLAGLPIPDSLRPVPKVFQRDVPEEPPPAPAPPPSGPQAESPTALPEARTDASEDELEDDDEEDEGPAEFAGDLGFPLADLLPQLGPRLAAAGVVTLRDLVLTRPRLVEHLFPVHGAGREMPPGRVAAGGRLRSAFSVLSPSGAVRRGAFLVGAGPLRVEWADPPPACWRDRDRRMVVAGTHVDGRLVDAEAVTADDHGVKLATWGLAGVEDRELRLAWGQLGEALAQVRDPLSPDVSRKLELPALGPAIAAAHQLLTEAGRRRLAFDEILLAQIAGVLPRFAPGKDRGLGHTVLHAFAGRMGQVHEIQLYDDAQLQLEEIKRDLRRSMPMRRVLTGEVGAGKGRIALLAAAMVADAKAQVLVLGSDAAEIEERYLHSEPLLRDGGLVARLVSSPPTKAQLDAIRRGEVHVLFGPIDLLEQPIEYRRLGLVVAVEREHWGRASVLHANLPAPRPDLLVVTAVPVGARVLATAYADHHVAVVKDPQRRPAKITLVKAEERGTAYARIREVVAAGGQGLVVFPLVDGTDAIDIPEAWRLVRALETDALSGLRVGLLHGAMSREDRVRVHEDLVHRRLDVLVSTTRFEEGPAVPAVQAVVIEQADRVDQIRLHRIIGHMSRAESRGPNPAPADAFLVVGELAEPDAAARIARVVGAPNGFQLTEALVQLRGLDRSIAPGSTAPAATAWFDPDADLPLLLAARDEAHRVLRADPQLRRGAHADLGRELRARWSRLFPDLAAQGVECPVREDAPVEPRKRRRRRRRRR